MKAKRIAYWTTTVLVAFFMSGGIAQIAQFKGNPHGVVPQLGYPMYFFAILGFWKVLGAIAILLPRFPRLKEWAYAGIFFDLTGAAASYAAAGDRGRLRLSHPRPSYPCCSCCGIMGASSGKP